MRAVSHKGRSFARQTHTQKKTHLSLIMRRDKSVNKLAVSAKLKRMSV